MVLKRRVEIVWSLITLDLIFAARNSITSDTAASFGLSLHEKSSAFASDCVEVYPATHSSLNSSPDDRHADDISAVNITLIHIWRDTVSYIAARDQEPVSFWATNSGRSRIMSRVLDLEISKSTVPNWLR